jgi:hypothetical protein
MNEYNNKNMILCKTIFLFRCYDFPFVSFMYFITINLTYFDSFQNITLQIDFVFIL